MSDSLRVPNEQGNVGKYDKDCEEVLRKLKAHTVLLIVVGGEKGGGFSVATADPRMTVALPTILEDVARNIRAQNEAAANS